MFKSILNIINTSRSVILTTHVIPDGDAIGSVLAMSRYLDKKGIENIIINHSPTPDNLKFHDYDNSIHVFKNDVEYYKEKINSSDLIILLDTNEFYRTKSIEKYFRNSSAKKICIDHHLGFREEEFDAAVCDTSYPANCQIIYDLIISDNPEYITKEIAEPLYTGIMTDTGSFRYPRVTSETFSICAALVSKGADPVKSYEEVYASNSIGKVKLTAKFLQSLEFYCSNKAVIGTVKKEDYESLGVEAEQVEGFTSFLMNIKGIKAGIVMVEYKENIKISFRSKGEIFVNEMAGELGGGGHKNAAGATVTGSEFLKLKENLKKLTEKYLN